MSFGLRSNHLGLFNLGHLYYTRALLYSKIWSVYDETKESHLHQYLKLVEELVGTERYNLSQEKY